MYCTEKIGKWKDLLNMTNKIQEKTDRITYYKLFIQEYRQMTNWEEKISGTNVIYDKHKGNILPMELYHIMMT